VYGPGFVEWTLLKPVADVFEGYRTFGPHVDIGYYNLLEHDHRKYMRVLANLCGVDGFIFYDYSVTTGPVLQRPTERMLLDGEPDKPFFFCWVRKGGGGGRSKAGKARDCPRPLAPPSRRPPPPPQPTQRAHALSRLQWRQCAVAARRFDVWRTRIHRYSRIDECATHKP